MPPRVVVIGGSLGGLNAALHLYRTGADVEVFERNGHEPRDDGAGVLLPPSTERLLAECGAFPVGVARTVRHSTPREGSFVKIHAPTASRPGPRCTGRC